MMSKFYKNAGFFALIFLAVLIFLDYLSMQDYWRMVLAKYTGSTEYIAGFPGSGEIKPYIEMVKRQDPTTKLIVGDSVCHQMFDDLREYNEDYMIAGTNGAITMAGQYILVKEYLDNHPDATDVYLFVLPQSLVRTFDTKNGYQYTVMPFTETGTIDDLDTETLGIMESVYGGFFMKPTVVEMIDLSGVNRKIYLNMLRDHTEGYVLEYPYEIADTYICKIDELCRNKNVNFHFYPCPVTENKKDYVNELAETFVSSKIYSVNPDYMDMIYYYPAEQSGDDSHFFGEWAKRDRLNEKIKMLYVDTEILDDLVLGNDE